MLWQTDQIINQGSEAPRGTFQRLKAWGMPTRMTPICKGAPVPLPSTTSRMTCHLCEIDRSLRRASAGGAVPTSGSCTCPLAAGARAMTFPCDLVNSGDLKLAISPKWRLHFASFLHWLTHLLSAAISTLRFQNKQSTIIFPRFSCVLAAEVCVLTLRCAQVRGLFARKSEHLERSPRSRAERGQNPAASPPPPPDHTTDQRQKDTPHGGGKGGGQERPGRAWGLGGCKSCIHAVKACGCIATTLIAAG